MTRLPQKFHWGTGNDIDFFDDDILLDRPIERLSRYLGNNLHDLDFSLPKVK